MHHLPPPGYASVYLQVRQVLKHQKTYALPSGIDLVVGLFRVTCGAGLAIVLLLFSMVCLLKWVGGALLGAARQPLRSVRAQP